MLYSKSGVKLGRIRMEEIDECLNFRFLFMGIRVVVYVVLIGRWG